MHSKLLVCLAFLVGLIYLVRESDACGFPMPAPVCGCGGGCGGGCGRRKRSIEQYPSSQLSTSAPQNQVIRPSDRTEESQACPQNEWLSSIVLNMTKDAKHSAQAIKQSLYQKYSTQFFVLCIPKGQRSFVANGEGYCSAETDDLWCHATAILA